MAELEVFPISIPGGINQSAPTPEESDFEELLNFGLFRNRLGLRAPLQLVGTLLDDQGTPAEVTSVLDIVDHQGLIYTASHSTITDKVYLHSMQVDGTVLTLRAVLWTGVISRPSITLTSFEGGDAANGVSRLYACDYNQNLPTVFWNGATVTTLTQDLDNDGVTAENIIFSLMIPFKFHLWGTGFYETAVLRPEMLRFSQPGLIPGTDDGGGMNPKEWHAADHRSVGRRGDKIVALSKAGDRLIVFQKRATHAVYGSGVNTWTRQELSDVIGCVGPHAVATVDERVAYFWASDGPYRTDGSSVQYIGDPIRQIAVEADASELDTRVGYSPDDGLVYFIVSPGGEDSYHLVLLFDHRQERWMKATWFSAAGIEAQFGAFTSMDSVAAPGPEGPPSGVSATATASNTIELAWTNGDVNVNTTTRIYRSTTSGFTPNDATNRIATAAAAVAGYEDTDSLSSATTYYYKLRHHRNSAFSSETAQVSAKTWLAPPTSLGLAGLTDGLRITGLNPVTGGDVVLQRRTSGGSFSTVHTFVAPGASFSRDEVLTCGVAYSYRARTELIGETPSEWTDTVTRDACNATVAPAAPSGLGVAVISTSQLNLSWTDNSDNEDEFQVYRSVSGEAFTLHASLPSNTSSYSDTGLASNTTYTYRVRAVNDAGNSTYTSDVEATTAPGLTAPTDLEATVISTSQINLTWTDTAADETSWEVEQEEVGGGYTRIATLGAGTTSYSATGLSHATSYNFRVRAVTGTSNGAYSNVANATTISGDAPAAPTVLTAVKNVGTPETRIDLAWTDNATNESEYEVQRKTGTGSWVVLTAVLPPDTVAYSDTTATPGTLFTYRVRALNGFGASTPSNEATETTDGVSGPPVAPSGLTAVGDDADLLGVEVCAVDLTWVDNSDNEDSFILERCIGAGCAVFSVIATLGAGIERYRDTALTDAFTEFRTVRYRVKARNVAGDSAYTAIAEATVEPQVAASGISAVSTSHCVGDVATPRMQVTWLQGDTTGINFRYIQRRPSGGEWATIATRTGGDALLTSFEDTTVTFGISFEYRIWDYYVVVIDPVENTGDFYSPASAPVAPSIPDCGDDL